MANCPLGKDSRDKKYVNMVSRHICVSSNGFFLHPFSPTNWLLTIMLCVGNEHNVDVDIEWPHTFTTINRDASHLEPQVFFFFYGFHQLLLFMDNCAPPLSRVAHVMYVLFLLFILSFQSGMHPHNAGFYTNNDTCLCSLSRTALVLDAYIWLRNLRDSRRCIDCRM